MDREGDVAAVAPMERSLRSVPPTYAPSLVFSHGKRYRDQTFCTLYDERCHARSIPQMRGMKCAASCFGWLILYNSSSTQCYLFNPISLLKIYLPPLIHNTLYNGVLTYPPTDPNCVVMLISHTNKKRERRPSAKRWCIYCRIGDNRWIEKVLQYTRKDKHRPNAIHGKLHVISCKGKIYLSFSEGMAVLDVHDTFSIKVHLWRDSDWDHIYTTHHHYTNFVVESCEEVFLVSQVHLEGAADIIQGFNVFKLGLCGEVLLNIESLDDRLFLLGQNSTASVSATELGMKGNCIYFTVPRHKSFYRYDMSDGTMTTLLPCPNMSVDWVGLFWMVPNCVEKPPAEVREANVIIYKQKSKWEELSPEILESVISLLFLGDCTRFSLTCKTWNSIPKPIREYSLLMQSKSGFQQMPWLLLPLSKNKAACTLYHPIYSDVYTINIPEVAGAVIRHSKYGWLLMSEGNSIFFFNPVTKEIIELPQYKKRYRFMHISFSAPPTSPEFTVFGHTHKKFGKTVLTVYFKEYDDWFNPSYSARFIPSYCNPVFHGGVYYCLSKDGRVGVFNPDEENFFKTWNLLPVPPVTSFPYNAIYSSTRNYIMEYGGDFFLVFGGLVGKPPFCVFKLDWSKMEWVRLESLRDKVIFLSHTTCMILPVLEHKGMEDRIYLPKLFQGKYVMFFSLRTGHYHCVGSKYSGEDWIANASENWNCSWVMLNTEHSNA